MSLTQAELRLALLAAGLTNATRWQFPHVNYEPVDYDFALANWRDWLQSRPDELTSIATGRLLPLYVPGCGDCSDLACGTMVWASVGNDLACVRNRKPRGGIAYGTMFYTASEARPGNYGVEGGHAINWFVDFDNKVTFFEPQAGARTEVNLIERSSAWFGIAI